MVDDDQQGVGHGHHCPLPTTTGTQP
jgi:hypothetical protein